MYIVTGSCDGSLKYAPYGNPKKSNFNKLIKKKLNIFEIWSLGCPNGGRRPMARSKKTYFPGKYEA